MDWQKKSMSTSIWMMDIATSTVYTPVHSVDKVLAFANSDSSKAFCGISRRTTAQAIRIARAASPRLVSSKFTCTSYVMFAQLFWRCYRFFKTYGGTEVSTNCYFYLWNVGLPWACNGLAYKNNNGGTEVSTNCFFTCEMLVCHEPAMGSFSMNWNQSREAVCLQQ